MIDINMINGIALGNMGTELVADTVAHTGKFIGFVAITACTIAAFKGHINGNTIVGVVVPAGMYFPTPFESITLTSGQALCIKGNLF